MTEERVVYERRPTQHTESGVVLPGCRDVWMSVELTTPDGEHIAEVRVPRRYPPYPQWGVIIWGGRYWVPLNANADDVYTEVDAWNVV